MWDFALYDVRNIRRTMATFRTFIVELPLSPDFRTSSLAIARSLDLALFHVAQGGIIPAPSAKPRPVIVPRACQGWLATPTDRVQEGTAPCSHRLPSHSARW